MNRHVALTADDRHALVRLARAVVWSGIEEQPIRDLAVPDTPGLQALGASFVTLERGNRLLGCIGTMEPQRPLYEDVMQNAYKSAFHDPRLPAVTADDFDAMTVKISVLGPLEPIPGGSRAELLAGLRPGVDGVLLVNGRARATFLPSVWDKVADPTEFVDLLLRKAGLHAHPWPRHLDASRYQTDEFGTA